MIALALGVGGLVVAAVAARAHLARRWLAVTVEGDSMAPTLRHGQRLLVARAAAPAVAVGDVIVFRLPRAPHTAHVDVHHLVKRVAAVAGDPLPAWAAGPRCPGDRVPPGRVVVIGDNPGRSGDSRQLGYVPVSAIVGVVAPRQLGGAR